MKPLAVLIAVFFFLMCLATEAQPVIRGKVVDTAGDPIGYANVGVVEGRNGTVSDEAGLFSLSVRGQGGRLKISAVGYESREVALAEFPDGEVYEVALPEKAYALPDVEVKRRQFRKEKVLGNRSDSKKVVATFIRNEPGTEIGAPIRVKREAWVKEARFNIAANNVGPLFFRVNLYELNDGKIGEKILREDVLIRTDIKEGEISVDLSAYNIIVDKDFLLSLEWLRDMGGGNISNDLQFSGGPFNGPFFLRYASQSDWKEMGRQGPFNVGLGFNVVVKY